MTEDIDIKAVMAESEDWQALQAQDFADTLDVYIDLKSPHAYLAIRPSLEVARDFKVRVNFLPYTLSYERLGVSKRVGPEMKRQPLNAASDRKARMYYAAAREYAALQALPLKSPHRLLDSDLAHRYFLFAKLHGLEVPFAMAVYLQGWGSGWREFELESSSDLDSACQLVGLDTSDLQDYVAEGGEAETKLAEIMRQAENEGFAGAPHYVFNDQDKDRRIGLFGREHLALIRSKYFSWGLARHADVQPDFSHAWIPQK